MAFNPVDLIAEEIQTTNFIWQLTALIVSFIAGLVVSRLLRAGYMKFFDHDGKSPLSSIPMRRLVSMVLILFFTLISREIFSGFGTTNLLNIFIPFLMTLVVILLVFFLLQPIVERGGRTGTFLKFFERMFFFFVCVLFLLHITGFWVQIIAALDAIAFTVDDKEISALMIIKALISIAVTMSLALWLSSVIESRLMRMEKVNMSVRVVISRIIWFTSIVFAALASLSMVGIDLTVLSIFGGAIAVGLGFGMQKIASNYVSGFIILLDGSIKMNDMIRVAGLSGRVTQISTRYTVLRDVDGIDSIIPNEMFVSSAVQNYSLADSNYWLSVNVSVAYGTDLDELFPILEEAVLSIPRVSKLQPPRVYFVGFGADGLELQVGFWIHDPQNSRLPVRSDVNLAIWRALKEHNVEIPYPQRVLHFAKDLQAEKEKSEISLGVDIEKPQ